LSRTQSDIDRLLKLRREAIEKPTQTDRSLFDLTDVSECAPALPVNIDWSLYTKKDPSPLRTLTHNIITTNSHTYPKGPHKIQRSPLSPLQRFVKDARVSILEPVLGVGLGLGSGISIPGGTASDIGITEAGGERDAQGPSTKFAKGEFVDSTPTKRRRSDGIAKTGEDVSMNPPPPTASTPVTETLPPIKLGKRARRVSSPSFHPLPKIDSTTQAKTKIKPETYKQAWTVSEQHLLERLLDEIPEGEKNRWVVRSCLSNSINHLHY
jgi:hypothetical protein